MIEHVKIAALRCTCDQCANVWHSLGTAAPKHCPACGKRTWNGTKRITSQPLTPAPKPRRVRTLEDY